MRNSTMRHLQHGVKRPRVDEWLMGMADEITISRIDKSGCFSLHVPGPYHQSPSWYSSALHHRPPIPQDGLSYVPRSVYLD